MKQTYINFNIGSRLRSVSVFAVSIVLTVAALLPVIMANSVNAATLLNRNVTISTSEISQTGVDWQFNFTLPSTTAVQGIIFEFCTTPLGACTHPAGLDNNYTTTATSGTQTFSEATAFTEYSGADSGACDDHNNGTPADSTEYCVTRTDGDAETAAAKQLTITGVTNANSETTVYVRITLYSDTAYATPVHDGVVAAAMVQQLTVTGRVQERLQFCVSAIGDTDALPAAVSNCTALTDTTIDIGVIDSSSAPSMAPVNTGGSTQGTDDFGIAMINTNAGGGTSLTFFAEDPTAVSGGDADQLKAFRVIPTNCDALATSATDQCFQSAANAGTGTTITAGNEWFGVYVPCVDTTQGVTATAMTVDSDFDGFDDDTASGDADCENTDKADNGGLPNIGWNSGTTATALASRAGVIDDAIVKLSFVAQAAATTPTGSYTVVSTYIATPTF